MGFWSKLKRAAKKVARVAKRIGRAAKRAVKQVVNVVKTVVNRVVGIVDFVASLIGIRPMKKLRLKVVILRKEDNSVLATSKDVWPSIEYAQNTFKKEAQVNIIPAGKEFVKTLDYPAPTEALDVNCDTEAWKEDFGIAGEYFGKNSEKNMSGKLTGYASPITVFIVRDVAKGNKAGCSLGPLTDYVTVDTDGLKGRNRTMAHEIGHACGLPHWRGNGTLMESGGTSGILKRWQKAVLRNSRHVTYF